MIDFNNDWDEPDIWSTPTHSPLTITQAPTSASNQANRTVSPSTLNLEASSVASSPVSSDESFHPVPSQIPDDHSNSDPGSSTPVAPNPSTNYLQNPSQVSLKFELDSSSINPTFSPPNLATSSWSSSFQHNSNLESISSQDLFHSSSSSGFDSSSIGFDQFNSHQGYTAQQDVNDEDEFGDFDDGETTTGEDTFGGFSTSSPFPPALCSTPIVPVQLPDQFTEEALRVALGPSLEALFESSPSPSDSSQAWLEEPFQCIQKKKIEQRPSSQPGQIPSILKSDELQATWQILENTGNKFGRPIEWKCSQIRRLHLVHLGIPVDLNDFLAPPPMARKSLAIDTKSPASTLNGKNIRQSPTILSSPFKGPMLDRRRCEELSGLSQASLSTKDPEQLESIRDQLKHLNQQASNTLALKQQQRDRSIQDCQAYNTMISDLVLAAQKIQMASPGSTKRASSMNLGSSSISSSSTKWIPLTRTSSHHLGNSSANSVPQTASTDTASASGVVLHSSSNQRSSLS